MKYYLKKTYNHLNFYRLHKIFYYARIINKVQINIFYFYYPILLKKNTIILSFVNTK